MKSEMKVPTLGESISEVTIGQILAPTGTTVQADAEVLELETDKVNQMLYAPVAGCVHLTVESGEVVKIGQTIGTIEPVEAAQPEKGEKPEKKAQEAEKGVPVSPALQSSPAPSSPLEEESIRLTKEDFLEQLKSARNESSIQSQPTPPTPPAAPFPPSPPSPPSSSIRQEKKRETRRPLSKIRKIIAQRMVEAHQTAAMLTTFNEIDLTQVIHLREKYREEFTKKYGCRLGFMSFFIKAVVSALQAFPELNSYLEGDEIVHREYMDIGVAVGTEKGVLVPVIRNCDQLKFAEIEQAIETYAKKAKEGKLVLADLQGAGFTITNGGIYGSLLSTPILVPPQCGILGMHKIEKRPVAMGDQVVIRPMMYVALSYDHRVIDGKEAVSFLVHLKEKLEDPSRLLLHI